MAVELTSVTKGLKNLLHFKIHGNKLTFTLILGIHANLGRFLKHEVYLIILTICTRKNTVIKIIIYIYIYIYNICIYIYA